MVFPNFCAVQQHNDLFGLFYYAPFKHPFVVIPDGKIRFDRKCRTNHKGGINVELIDLGFRTVAGSGRLSCG